MQTVLLIFGMLAAYYIGCWTTHKAYQKEMPVPQLPEKKDDMPGPISPLVEDAKTKKLIVKER